MMLPAGVGSSLGLSRSTHISNVSRFTFVLAFSEPSGTKSKAAIQFWEILESADDVVLASSHASSCCFLLPEIVLMIS